MLRRLAYLLLIAALAVVGISMSVHSATPAGHVTIAPSAASASALEATHDHAPSLPEVPAGDAGAAACLDCSDDHSALVMVCAFLALLLVVSVLLPALALRSGFPSPTAVRVLDPPGRAASPRPPDLTELCISRQ